MTRFVVLPLIVVAIAFLIFSIVDIALSNKNHVRAFPKPLWLLIVLLPIIGPILWFLFGRGRGRKPSSAERRVVAPDDDPQFLRNIGTEENQNERIRRLEQELSELDDDTPTS
jgi:hypothetical protein